MRGGTITVCISSVLVSIADWKFPKGSDVIIVGSDGHNLMPTCSNNNNHTSPDFKKSNKFSYTSHDLVARKYYDETTYSPVGPNQGNSAIWKDLKAIFIDPYFAPLMADDLTNLPTAYVITAQYDVLRDDGIMYARRLEKAGVKVVHHNYEGAMHTVLKTLKYDVSKKCFSDMIDFISKNL